MSNLTVLVTGGASGIGKACALTFAQAGYNVVVNYGHSEQAALEVTKQCSRAWGRGICGKSGCFEAR
jgi:3-oxoacyl-[acyl-carrier protein] reductase